MTNRKDTPDIYVFNDDASEFFFQKLDALHEEYVHHLLMSGLAPKGADLESVKMTKNPQVSRKYCERVVGGLINIKPQIITRLLEDKELRLECIFTKINDNEHLNHLYMIQNVMDWPKLGSFSCQIWYLGEITPNQIKEHWD